MPARRKMSSPTGHPVVSLASLVRKLSYRSFGALLQMSVPWGVGLRIEVEGYRALWTEVLGIDHFTLTIFEKGVPP